MNVVAGSAPDEAKQILAMWGSRITGNPQPKQDLIATAAGTPFNSCGHSILLDADLLHVVLIALTQFKMVVWNYATGHACDPYYHPPGAATDIASITEISTGLSSNFYPGTVGNNPAVIARFDNLLAARGPSKLALGQSECSDHSQLDAAAKAISFPDGCTHQHLNVHQNDPIWGRPWPPESWPK